MNNKQKISISYIIPVFNMEDEITSILEQLLSQIDDNDEVIVVNDGSSDKTEEKISLIVDDKLVFLNSNKNRGVSFARNRGMAVAKSDYITFVDADDYLEDHYFSKIKKMIFDLKYPKLFKFFHSGFNFDLDSGWIGREKYKELYYQSNLMNSCWGQLINREFLTSSKVQFKEGLNFGEDMLFTFSLINLLENIFISNEKFYNYQHNPKGLSKSLSSKSIINRIEDVSYAYSRMLVEIENDRDFKETLSKKKNHELANLSLKLRMISKNDYKNYYPVIRNQFISNYLSDNLNFFYTILIKTIYYDIGIFLEVFTLLIKIKYK